METARDVKFIFQVQESYVVYDSSGPVKLFVDEDDAVEYCLANPECLIKYLQVE